MIITTSKSYSDLLKFNTFHGRFEYLKLDGCVGLETFGSHRYMNQILYSSSEWKSLRRKIILRDEGCDLGVRGCEIYGKIMIHHIEPITIDDIRNHRYCVYDPDNLICSSFETHNAIHYGNENQVPAYSFVCRKPNDTCLWR